jgi:two-component system, NarL family, response regulator LiaR
VPGRKRQTLVTARAEYREMSAQRIGHECHTVGVGGEEGNVTIRIMVVDDHPLMRQAVRMAIDLEPDLVVVGEAEDGEQAISQARLLRPDVIVMDLLMPGKDGLQATREILAEQPDACILALTSATETEKIGLAIDAGARGYLLKDAQRDQVLTAIRELGRGNAFLPPEIARKYIDRVRQAHTPAVNREVLTDREQEVFKWVVRGASNREIAETLSLSESTVRVHLSHILAKLGFANRHQAIVYALREGILSD